MTEEEILKQYKKNVGEAIDKLEELPNYIEVDGDTTILDKIEDIIKTLQTFEVV